MTDTNNNKSFIQNLWDRRFFQYFATYLGVCWGFIQFSEWIINRYGFDSIYIDRIALFLFGLLPAMAAFIYVHGAPGHDAWRKFEKVLYPLNFVLALAASAFLVSTSAQSSTRQIEVTNEVGDTIVRQVPKMEFTKRVVFFPLESDLNSDEEWVEIGIPVLSDLDIEQDMEWYSIRPTSLDEECEDYGYNYLDEIPFSVKIKVAKDLYCDYFVEGDLKKNDSGYELQLRVFRSKDGKEMYNDKLISENIFGLADQISAALNANIEPGKIEAVSSYIDLPSSDLISDDLKAFEAFVKSRMLLNEGKDYYQEAATIIQQSIASDPNCAECYTLLAQIQSTLGADGSQAANQAVLLSENLPERQKLEMKYYNYMLSRDPAKARKLLEYWKNLYPQDIIPFSRLIALSSQTLNFQKAEKITKEALDAGHEGSILLTAADVAVKMGKLKEAEFYIAKYENKYPEKAAKKSLLGEIFFAKGDFQKAIDIYDQNIILNPNNVGVYNKIAEAYIHNLEFENGFAAFEDGLKVSKNVRDSIQVYQKIMEVSILFGFAEKFEDAKNKSRELHYSNYPKAAFLQVLLTSTPVYASIGDMDGLERNNKETLEICPEPAKPLITKVLNYLNALVLEDKEGYAEAWNSAKDFLISSSGETMKLQGELFTHYFNEDWDAVLNVFQEYKKIVGSFINNAAPLLTECYINLDRIDEGYKIIDEFLATSPNNPNLLMSKFKLFINDQEWNKAETILPLLEKSFSYTDDRWEYKRDFIKLKEKLADRNG